MATPSTSQALAAAETDDPYVLRPHDVMEAPTGWRSSLKHLGPGLIVSASIVGSGELIATTALGAEVGFALLWLVIVSVLVKVAIQVQMARWAISTGRTPLDGLNTVPPKLGRASLVNLLYCVNLITKLIQYGGIVGGVAAACSILLPLSGAPLSFRSLAVWTVIVVVVSVALLYSNRYSVIERGAVILVGLFVALSCAVAVGLVFTPFSYDVADVLSGFEFRIPAGAIGVAMAMFGLVGVNADEIIGYNYWCIEKGYARWAGPNDGSESWVRRANGWIHVMYKDVALSLVVYTVGTLVFYVMGAAVLNPQGLIPEGNEMIVTLSRTYTDVLGEWVNVVYLLGAIAVLGSTLWAGLAGFSRMYTNLLSSFGFLDWGNVVARRRSIRFFTVVLPIVWGAAYLFISQPVLMIQISGVAGGLFLAVLVPCVWYLGKKDIDPRLHGGPLFKVMLVVSSIAILLLGAYTVLSGLGIAG
jgi:Mn2+/Fe2+ NRAMP family transporter